jgi:GAF domain-containing protein
VAERAAVDLPQQTRAALDELALLVLDQQSTQTVLQKVVDLVARVMPADADVSVTVVRNETLTTAAYTGTRALALDQAQYRCGYGPSVEAAIDGHVIEITDSRTETRWPEHVPAFLDAGVLSSVAVPVPAVQMTAALNVYAPTAGALSRDDRRAIARFADFAAVALTNMDALQDARELTENLRRAMEFRSVIEQAKGILIERHRVTADEAFRLLTHASQRSNKKLRDVAQGLVLTGELDQQAPAREE